MLKPFVFREVEVVMEVEGLVVAVVVFLIHWLVVNVVESQSELGIIGVLVVVFGLEFLVDVFVVVVLV
ncbi:hypothetical protein AAHH80_33350, partial [Burkholderia pseudomallei]